MSEFKGMDPRCGDVARRTAPVQGDGLIPGGRIPWALHVLAWQAYGYNQSAERIAERGGFSWAEIVALLRNDYRGEGSCVALRQLTEIVNQGAP